jgi:alpha-tubulin suppressor-like RCC1 family protein
MALHIQQIACGREYSLVLLSNGSVWASGRNIEGQLGDGTHDNRFGWVCVMPSGGGVVQVAAGEYHSLALKSDGSVLAVGRNNFGQLGDGTTITQASWKPVISAGSGITQVVTGGYHSLALNSDGAVLATGHNSRGQLGDGGETKIGLGWKLVVESGVTQVSAGFLHSLALKSDGSVWATGFNGWGQLGDGSATNRNSRIFKRVVRSNVTSITCGEHYSLILQSGSVLGAGCNELGQLGVGTWEQRCTAFRKCFLDDVMTVVAGKRHSFSIQCDGSLWATGKNEHGDIGNFDNQNKGFWFPVISSGVSFVSAGATHSLLVKSDGTLWKTGDNHYGQLGYKGVGSNFWIPDRFFEQMLLESLMGDPGSLPDRMPDADDNWRGFSL